MPSENIQVAVRVRNIPTWHGRDPNSDKHTDEHNKNIVQLKRDPKSSNNQIDIQDPKTQESKSFSFDYLFAMEDGQDAVFGKVVEPIVDKCLNGFNGCIFCYGQTASGKTFTMGGVFNDLKNKGIIPRVAEQIVAHIENASLTGSYLEIYQEELRDLLADDDKDLKIRVDPSSVSGKDMYVQGLTQSRLFSVSDYQKTVEKALAKRVVAETNMNAVSSRSHSVFTITITQNERFQDEKGGIKLGIKKRSKIHLIDLAGSERASSTGATGVVLKEGAAINQSLSCLGNVINALSTNSKHVPYRDSKLTYLLSDSLGGNSITLMIACLTPIAGAFEETLSTLRFAERAKKIKNKAILNVDATTLRIMALEAENAELKLILSQCKCGASPNNATQQVIERQVQEVIQKQSRFRKLSSKLQAISGFGAADGKVAPMHQLPGLAEMSEEQEQLIEEDVKATSKLTPLQAPAATANVLPPIETEKEEGQEEYAKYDIEATPPASYNYHEYLDWYRKTYTEYKPTSRYVKVTIWYIIQLIILMFVCYCFGFGTGYLTSHFGGPKKPQ